MAGPCVEIQPAVVFRCVVCWYRTPWEMGCDDGVDRSIVAAATSFRDPRALVSDGGLCDGCWLELGGEMLSSHVQSDELPRRAS